MSSLPFGMLHLGSLPLLSTAQTRSICAENPDGSRGGGAKAVPGPDNSPAGEPSRHPAAQLGKGWKVRPCLDLDPGSVTTLADIKGPGVIQHIWITVDHKRWRDLVLRFYWDGEKEPSIEVPLGDFFACGHNVLTKVNSLPIAVNPKGGLNCYWPMPFRKSARITVENNYMREKLGGFFFQITYALQDVPEDAAYLHAQWRRSLTTRDYPEHVLLEGVEGQGHYVGTYLAWATSSDIWWGEGEVKFYLDGDGEHPTICGTGTEDYFGGAWGFYGPGPDDHEEAYSTPFLGLPLVDHVPHKVPKFGLYRWHIMDPIRFTKDLKVTIQALGWWPSGKFQPLCDDIASTALWYQTEPHAPFPALPPVEERWPR
jgi:hypothetical protein